MTAIVLIVGAAIVCGLFPFQRNPQYYDNLYDRYLIVTITLYLLPMDVILLMFRATPESFGFAKVKSRQIWVLTVALFAGLFVLMS